MFDMMENSVDCLANIQACLKRLELQLPFSFSSIQEIVAEHLVFASAFTIL